MKVVLVHNYYQQRGGEDIVFESERDLLRRHGHAVVEYCRSNKELPDRSYANKLMAAKTALWASDSRREFYRLLEREKPDIVHVHNTFLRVSPSIYWACHEAGVPVVQTLHNYRLFCPAGNFMRAAHVCEECVGHSLMRAVRYRCYRGSRSATATVASISLLHRWLGTWSERIDRYIVPSNFTRNKFVEAGLSAAKLVVKPNFIHPDPGCRTEAEDYVVFVGRLSEEKGVATLLAAFQLLPQPMPLVIFGEGPLRQVLEQEAAARGLSSYVRFCGWAAHRDALRAVRAARFLVVPSVGYETFGNAIAEAYACGVPVIASALGAIEDIVCDGETGLLVRAGDAADLAEKIAWAWAHPQEMKSMGRAARLEYEARYTAARNHSMLMNIYEATITAPRFALQLETTPAA
jgi:glycosyltransferase involved in cell wall biosynthesis